MTTRFYNGKILTLKNDFEILDGYELWVQDDKISYLGKAKNTDICFDKQINLNGNLLMPGFKNTHTHSAMTFLRSYADDVPLQEWLNEKVFPMEAKLTADMVYCFTVLAICEYLSSGITTCFDMYLYPSAVAKASLDTGFRTVLCGEINNFSGSIDSLEKMYLEFNQPNSLVSCKLGFHAEYTCSKDLLQNVTSLSKKYNAPVYTHLSETAFEVDDCIKRTGYSPLEYLDSLGLFDNGGGCFHCVHLTDNDVNIIKNKKLNVVTCPASNIKLASGIADLKSLVDNAINISIGTDGAASNNNLNMFKEMFLACGMQKIKHNDAAIISAEQIVKMACVNSAHAVQLTQCDSLDVGKKADMIVVDLKRPNMQPLHNIVKNLVYCADTQNILLTIVNGNILYENGNYNIGISLDELYSKIAEYKKILFDN